MKPILNVGIMSQHTVNKTHTVIYGLNDICIYIINIEGKKDNEDAAKGA